MSGPGAGSRAPAGADRGGGAVHGASRPASGRRSHRRVVALSQRDRQRVEQGLEPEDLARADYDNDALTAHGSGRGGGAGSANDARLLADVPPHWQ